MRAPFTSIPSIVNPIAHSFHVPATSLGILTTIPLLCFALFSSFAPGLGKKLGNEVTIALALGLLILGSALRIFSFSALMIGTVLIGLATTFLNVLLPAIVAEKMPTQIGPMTSLYNVSLTMFSAIGAYLITPVANATNWQTGVLGLTGLVIITLLLWLPNLGGKQEIAAEVASEVPAHNMFKNRRAWYLALYFGLSSFVFYTTVAWLPSIAMSSGLSATNASLVAGLFQLFSMPTAFIVPMLATKLKNRNLIVVSAAALTIAGYLGLLVTVNSLPYFVFLSLLLGLGTASTFGLIMTLFGIKTDNPADTRALSGMVQTLGYLMAAIGPWVTGQLKAVTGNWHLALWVTIFVGLLFTTFGYLSERHDLVVEK